MRKNWARTIKLTKRNKSKYKKCREKTLFFPFCCCCCCCSCACNVKKVHCLALHCMAMAMNNERIWNDNYFIHACFVVFLFAFTMAIFFRLSLRRQIRLFSDEERKKIALNFVEKKMYANIPHLLLNWIESFLFKF